MTDYDPEPNFLGLTEDEQEQYFADAADAQREHMPRWFSN